MKLEIKDISLFSDLLSVILRISDAVRFYIGKQETKVFVKEQVARLQLETDLMVLDPEDPLEKRSLNFVKLPQLKSALSIIQKTEPDVKSISFEYMPSAQKAKPEGQDDAPPISQVFYHGVSDICLQGSIPQIIEKSTGVELKSTTIKRILDPDLRCKVDILKLKLLQTETTSIMDAGDIKAALDLDMTDRKLDCRLFIAGAGARMGNSISIPLSSDIDVCRLGGAGFSKKISGDSVKLLNLMQVKDGLFLTYCDKMPGIFLISGLANEAGNYVKCYFLVNFMN